jgi:integrase
MEAVMTGNGLMATKITKRIVDAATPGERDLFLWDEEVKGFGLKVTPAGSKVYMLQYRMGGRATPTRRYTIGKHGSPWTPDEARDEAKRLLREVVAGRDPVLVKREALTAKPADSFKTVALDFIERYHKAKGNRYTPAVQRILKRDLFPKWGERPITEITRRDVMQVLDEIAARAPVQANRTLSVVSKLFNWAIDRDIIQTSPVVRIPKPGKETVRDRCLTDNEIRAIWMAAETVGWPFGPCVKLLILTAQRRDEVAHMRWSEIDLIAGMWTLPRERAKNGKAHEVPLSPMAVDVLRSLPRPDGVDLVFTTNGKTPISGFSQIKKRLDALSKVGLTDADEWVFHDFRRTVTTNLAKMGIPPQVADKVLNHVQGTIKGVAAVYNRHAYLDERRAALDAWANRLDLIINDTSGGVVPLTKQTA